MNRRIAFRVAVLVSAAGALSIACGASSDRENPGDSTEQALRPVGTDDPPVLSTPVDAGHDSGPVQGPVFTPPILRLLPSWATTCTTNRYFVRRETVFAKMGAPASFCADVDSPNGKWTGSSLFPQVPNSAQCIYDWTPDAAHASATAADYASLELVAATSYYIRSSSTGPHPDIKADCHATTCGVGTAGTCLDVPPTPACDDTIPDAGPDGGCHHGETGPICESCAIVHDGGLMVVLPPQITPIRLLARPQSGVGIVFTAPVNVQTFRVPVTSEFTEGTILDLTYPLD